MELTLSAFRTDETCGRDVGRGKELCKCHSETLKNNIFMSLFSSELLPWCPVFLNGWWVRALGLSVRGGVNPIIWFAAHCPHSLG